MSARVVCELSIDHIDGLEHSESQTGVDMDSDTQMDIDILIWIHITDLGVDMGHDIIACIARY